MDWWQILLIGVASLVVGALLGTLVHFLLRQLAQRREAALVTEEKIREPAVATPETEAPVIKEPVAAKPAVEAPVIKKPVIEAPVIKKPVIEAPVIKKPVIEAPVIKKPVIEAPVIKETVKETLPGLVEEIETNIKIATQPWISKLLPFQTRVWEGIQDTVNNMPANAQEDLRQTYVDIRLANSIVRLATQFNRRSQSLDDSYQKLCAAIAEKLSKIKPLIS